MKEYKGLYHNVEENRKSFEYGAHFKYSELYNALKDLKLKKQNENTPLGENNNSYLENENKEEVTQEKKRKRYKLKTLNIEENNRYLIKDIEPKRNERNELIVIEEENDKKKHSKKRKNRLLTKSIEKVHLPKISSNNLFSLEKEHLKTESKEAIKLYQSYDFNKKRKINFPKINSLHKENFLPEISNNNKKVETKSFFEDKGDIKIYNDSTEEQTKNQASNNKEKNKKIPKIFLLNKDKEKEELLPITYRKNDRLKSIFEKEKIIKSNNLFLGERNNYKNKEKRDIINDPIAQQIHYLRKQLLGKKDL